MHRRQRKTIRPTSDEITLADSTTVRHSRAIDACACHLLACNSIHGQPGRPEVDRPDEVLDFRRSIKRTARPATAPTARTAQPSRSPIPSTSRSPEQADHRSDITPAASPAPHACLRAKPPADAHRSADRHLRSGHSCTHGAPPEQLAGANRLRMLPAHRRCQPRAARYTDILCTCHGADGQGRHWAIRNRRRQTRLASSTLLPRTSQRPVLAQHHHCGPSRSGHARLALRFRRRPLTDQQITDIVAWLASMRVAEPGPAVSLTLNTEDEELQSATQEQQAMNRVNSSQQPIKPSTEPHPDPVKDPASPQVTRAAPSSSSSRSWSTEPSASFSPSQSSAISSARRSRRRQPTTPGSTSARSPTSPKARPGWSTSATPSPTPGTARPATSPAGSAASPANSFQVFAINCAHLGCPVRWFAQSKLFMCPCHGGAYYADGSRASGPPERGLFEYDHKIANGALMISAGECPRSPTKRKTSLL